MPGSLDDKEPAEAKSQGFEVQITNEMLVPVYDFHYQARAILVYGYRPAFMTINGTIYLIQICIWIYS